MTLLTKNSTPAERERGCVFSETFENSQAVVKNGGTITGTPTINNKVTFDGTNDWIQYGESPITTAEADTDVSIVIDFDLAINQGAIQTLTEVSPGLATGDSVMVLFDTNNYIRLYYSDAAFICDGFAVPAGRHTVTCTVSGGVTKKVYLDGVELTGSTVGATGVTSLGMSIGARLDNSLPANGTIYSVKYFRKILTLQEHTDLYNNTTYEYRNQKVVDLPMDFERFDASNAETLDISGNLNDAGITNATKLADRKGFNFDGTGDYLTVTHDSTLNIGTGDYTYSMWVYITVLEKAQHHTLIVKDDPETATGWIFQVIAIGATPGTLNLRRNAGNVYNSTQQLQQGTWNHVVTQRIGANHYFFLNGILDATSGSNAFDMDNTEDMLIGYRNVAYNGYLQGRIAEVKQWNSALTRMQIKDLYLRELKQVNTK